MEKVIKYFQDKKYKVEDCTSSFDKGTLWLQFERMKHNDKLVIMYKNIPKTREFFQTLVQHSECEYVFFNKDNYLALSSDDMGKFQKLIDDFINDKVICHMCGKAHAVMCNCNKCFASICFTCINIKKKDGIVKCSCGYENTTTDFDFKKYMPS